MTSFPLYNQLLSEITCSLSPDSAIKDEDKSLFVDTVPKMSDLEHELIFTLIRSHQVHEGQNILYILPYNAKHQKKGIKFDFCKLPAILQHILILFIKKHFQNI